MTSSGTWWMWLGFIAFVIFVLFIDMFILGGKKSHKVSLKEALFWVITWMTCAFLFNGLFWWYLTHTATIEVANRKALEFFAGFMIEQSLSVDNMFAFIMIFNYFAVPAEYQRRVLLYGVISAIIFRFIMIVSGTWLVGQLHWVLYIFGAFLVMTGIKMLFPENKKDDPSYTRLFNWIRRHIRLTDYFHQEKFFIRQKNLWYATPLFVVLILIELSDLIFALDSIPAIFAITNDAFIIFTSNIFAILGLRALYFVLANMAMRFHLLKYGIALLLTFIGLKMLLEPWIEVPISVTLCVIMTILGTTAILSIYFRTTGKP